MKNKKTILFNILLILSISGFAQKSTWTFDKSHSKIQFSVSHMVISEVTGQFHDYDGTATFEKSDLTNIHIDFSIDVKSVDTDDENRDKHLRTTDFFDVEKYPKIIFKGTSMKKISDKMYKLEGSLTMHGVTKIITLDVKYGGMVTDPYGNLKAGFKITGTINRTDFGLKYNSVMDSGGLMIGEEVEIICNVELFKE